MKKRWNTLSMSQKLWLTLVALLLSILLLWSVFYLGATRIIKRNIREMVAETAEQSLALLEENFLAFDHVSMTMGQNKMVKEFVKTKERLSFYDQAKSVNEVVDLLTEQNEWIDGLLVYQADGSYYRFIGDISNTVCENAYYLAHDKILPKWFVVQGESTCYLGYTSGIYEKEKLLGTILILVDERKLYQMLESIGQEDSVRASILIDGEIIASNGSGDESDVFCSNSVQVGFTPFQIRVTGRDTHIAVMNRYFTATVFITAFFFSALILLYTMYWRNQVVLPIMRIMGQIEEMARGERSELSGTKQFHFIGIEKQINHMYLKREEYNKAMFSSLKKQINAHFTINVLNSIKYLAKEKNLDKTCEMCDGLSQLFRYSCAKEEFLPALDELQMLEKYLSIMEIRYPGRFRISLDFDDRIIDYSLPRMMIQPIIENAILYGLSIEAANDISLNISMDTFCIWVTVEDHGIGMREEELRHLQETLQIQTKKETEATGTKHIALINIATRLQAYYGDDYKLEIESCYGKGCKVKVPFGLRPIEGKS